MKTISLRRHPNGSDFNYSYYSGEGHSFFRRRPRLAIKRIENLPIPMTVAWQTPNTERPNPMEFNAMIWTLEICNPRSRLSGPATKCSPTLHIKDSGVDIPLRWKSFFDEPNTCLLNERPADGESPTSLYHRIMPYFYTIGLAQRQGKDAISIHVGERYNLYFLFTYEGSNHAFIITPLQFPIWYGEKEIFYNNVVTNRRPYF